MQQHILVRKHETTSHDQNMEADAAFVVDHDGKTKTNTKTKNSEEFERRPIRSLRWGVPSAARGEKPCRDQPKQKSGREATTCIRKLSLLMYRLPAPQKASWKDASESKYWPSLTKGKGRDSPGPKACCPRPPPYADAQGGGRAPKKGKKRHASLPRSQAAPGPKTKNTENK